MEASEWHGPGSVAVRLFDHSDLGEPLAISQLLGRTRALAIGLTGLVAYRDGFLFHIALQFAADQSLKKTVDETPHHPYGAHHLAATAKSRAELDDPQFRHRLQRKFHVHVGFANGYRSTTLDPLVHDPWQATTSRPLVVPLTGFGGTRRWEILLAVFPLPPPGVLALGCKWEELDVAFEAKLDAGQITEAARRSKPM